MEELDPLREELGNIAADLLSYKRYVEVVRRILAGPVGVWQTVAFCCAGLIEPPDPIAAVVAREANSFYVMHLPWPGLEPGDQHRMILFVHEADLWSSVALYNWARLETA